MSNENKTKKPENPSNPKGAGRKWFDGKDEAVVISKLKDAFNQGSNVIRACAYAEISRESYYRYVEAHPELRDIFEQIRLKPVLKAEAVIIKKLNEDDVDTAKWYLERKAKGEYSSRQEVATVDPDEDELTEQEKEKLRDILRKNNEPKKKKTK